MFASLSTSLIDAYASFFNNQAQAADSQPSNTDTQQQATDAPVKTKSNKEIRASYNVQISAAYETEFKDKFASFHAQEQCFGEGLAREAFEVRTAIKEKHQEETSTLGRIGIALRNVYKYGALNVGYEQLVKSGKNPEEIAYSAFSTGGGDLGLESNGFADTINVWRAVKDDNPHIYPENITPKMIAAYKAQSKNKNVDVDTVLAAGSNRSSTPDPFECMPKPISVRA